MAKTVVGFFDSYEDARGAYDELVRQGFDRKHVSLITNRDTYRGDDKIAEHADEPAGAAVGAATGAVVGGSAMLIASLIPGVGPVLAVGPLLATLLGAGVGAVAGGLIGALVDSGVSEEDARLYQEGVRRGGSLLIVRADNNEMAQRAAKIMNQNDAVDIKRRSAEWKSGTSAPAGEPSGAGASASAGSQQRGQQRGGQMERERATAGTRGGPAGNTGQKGEDRGGNRAEDEEPVVLIVEEIVAVAEDQGDENMPGEGGGRAQGMRETAGRKGNEQRMGGQKGEGGDEAATRRDFDDNFATSGMNYEQFAPAYRYGSELCTAQRNSNKDWNQVEPDARRAWESKQPGTWERVKEAVRHGWQRVKEKVS